MSTKPPFAVTYDLAKLSEKGVEIALTPSAAERAAIAAWLGIGAVDGLTATVRLTRNGRDFYGYEGEFEADVVQACVVTLEPVPAHVGGQFHRSFRFVSPNFARRQEEAAPSGEISLSDSDDTDIIDGTTLDLAAPILEELSLSLDPYPRASGASFAAPAAEEPAAGNPFAVLKALKDNPSPATPKRKT